MHQLLGLRGSRILPTLFSVLCLLPLGSCETAVVTSRQLATVEAVGPSKAFPGLVYSLPRGQVRLVAERKKLGDKHVEEAAAKLAILRAELAALEAPVAELARKEKSALVNYNSALASYKKAAKPIATMLEDDKKKVADAKAALAGIWANAKTELDAQRVLIASHKKAVSEQKEILAAALAGEQRRKNETPLYEETIALELLPVAPDPTEVYVTNLNHSSFRDDNMDLTVENGLLSSGTFTSIDQTPSILLKLAQGIAAFAGVPGGVTLTQKFEESGQEGALPTPCPLYKLDVTFDPANGDEVAKVQSLLAASEQKSGYKLQICSVGARFGSNENIPPADSSIEECYALDAGLNKDKLRAENARAQDKIRKLQTKIGYYERRSSRSGGNLGSPETEDRGFVYRIARPYRIDVTPSGTCPSPSPAQAKRVVVTVPDSSLKFVLPMTAGAFTKNVVTANFKNGMPIKYTVDRPSEVNTIAGLPIDIAKAIISVPTDMVKLKVDYNSQDAALTEAQKNAIDAEIALIEAQQRYKDAVEAAKESNEEQ